MHYMSLQLQQEFKYMAKLSSDPLMYASPCASFSSYCASPSPSWDSYVAGGTALTDGDRDGEGDEHKDGDGATRIEIEHRASRIGLMQGFISRHTSRLFAVCLSSPPSFPSLASSPPFALPTHSLPLSRFNANKWVPVCLLRSVGWGQKLQCKWTCWLPGGCKWEGNATNLTGSMFGAGAGEDVRVVDRGWCSHIGRQTGSNRVFAFRCTIKCAYSGYCGYCECCGYCGWWAQRSAFSFSPLVAGRQFAGRAFSIPRL